MRTIYRDDKLRGRVMIEENVVEKRDARLKRLCEEFTMHGWDSLSILEDIKFHLINLNVWHKLNLKRVRIKCTLNDNKT